MVLRKGNLKFKRKKKKVGWRKEEGWNKCDLAFSLHVRSPHPSSW